MLPLGLSQAALAPGKGYVMTREEWLQIGYEKRLIDDVAESEMLSFRDAYKMWFKMKINRIRPQSCDRIEVTYNRYFLLRMILM